MAAVRDARRPLPPTRGGSISRDARVPGAASWADMLIALAATALTMGVLILVATFAGENVAGDDAGRFWALTFAVALGMTGVFLVLLGLVLLGERARERGRYLVPLASGVAAGSLVGALILDGASREAVLAPLLLLLLALPPVRGGLARLMRRQAGERRG